MAGTILLADDSITIQKVVELTFASTDSEVVAVGSGRELLERLPEVKPQVVLCDVVMPDMNGYDVCQQIKSDPATLHIPVVLLTGTFEPFDRERAIAAGCDNIVTKPFEAKELVAIVEELLARAAATEPEDAGEAAQPMPDEAGEVPEDGLDFTTTGFDKMVPPEDLPAEPPSHGLDVTGSFREEFAAPRPTDADTQPVTPVFGEREAPAPVADEPFGAEPVADEAGWETAASPVEPVEPVGQAGFGEEDEFGGETVAVAPEPAGAAGDQPDGLGEAGDEPVGAELASSQGWVEEETAVPAEAEPVEEVEAARADDVSEPVAVSAVAGPLSDDDVERIARRVVELAAPQLERIAWDVIPDMAEMLVRKRIRELEAAVEDEN